MPDNIIKLPKKSNNFTINLGEKKVKLNFGLQFACAVDSYLSEEAAAQGIDNLAIIATRLVMRSPSTLLDLLSFALSREDVTEDELVNYVEAIAEKGEDAYNALFDYFFTNLLASPSLSLKARKALPVINQMTQMMKSQEEALLMGLTEINEEMEIQLAAAKAMLREQSEQEENPQ